MAAAAIPALIGAGSNLLSGWLGSRAQNEYNDLIRAAMQSGYDIYNQGIDSYNTVTNPFLQLAYTSIPQTLPMIWGGEEGPGWLPGLMNELQIAGEAGPLWERFQNNGLTNEMWSGLGALSGAAQGQAPTTDIARQVFAGGGWTPGYEQLWNQGQGFLTGQGPEMGTMGQLGVDLAGRRGQTDFTRGLQGAGLEALSSGGFSPALRGLQEAGFGIANNPYSPIASSLAQGGFGALGNNGLTDTGAAGEGVALEMLLGGGASPMTDFLQQRAAGALQQEPLMSPELAVSLARERAGQAYAQQAEGVQRRALARGGGPGNIVAAGVQNQGMADFADQMARGTAAEVGNALQRQQELALQRENQMLQAGLGAAGEERARLGTGGNILQGLEDVASRRFGIGGGMMTDAERLGQQRLFGGLGLINPAEQTAIDRSQVMGGLGLGAGNLENQFMGTGLQGLDAYNRLRLGAFGQLGNLQGQQNQYALGAGQLATQGTGLEADIYNNWLRNVLGAGQQGLDRVSQFTNAQRGLFDQRGQAASQGLNWMTSFFNPLTNISGQQISRANAGLGIINPQAYSQGSAWSGPLQNIANIDWRGTGGGGQGGGKGN